MRTVIWEIPARGLRHPHLGHADVTERRTAPSPLHSISMNTAHRRDELSLQSKWLYAFLNMVGNPEVM